MADGLNAKQNANKGPKGSARSSVKRSKGSSHVVNSTLGAVPIAGMAGPMGVAPQGGGQVANPMLAPKMPGT